MNDLLSIFCLFLRLIKFVSLTARAFELLLLYESQEHLKNISIKIIEILTKGFAGLCWPYCHFSILITSHNFVMLRIPTNTSALYAYIRFKDLITFSLPFIVATYFRNFSFPGFPNSKQEILPSIEVVKM